MNLDDKMTSKADISKASGIQKSWHLQKSGVLNNFSHTHTKTRSMQHYRSSEHPKPVSLVTKKGTRSFGLTRIYQFSLMMIWFRSEHCNLVSGPGPARSGNPGLLDGSHWSQGAGSGYKSRIGSYPHSVETNEQSKQQANNNLRLLDTFYKSVTQYNHEKLFNTCRHGGPGLLRPPGLL